MLVRALPRTYQVSQDRHDPGEGDDAMTFGIHVWKSGVHYLRSAVTAFGGTAEVMNQSLAMRIEDVELRHHKLGDSETDNPEASFPHHAGPAARMAGRAAGVQLDLPLSHEGQVAAPVYLDWVLASYGNPEEGLRAVRLQAVGCHRALDGTISRWEDIVTLYDASLGAELPTMLPSVDVPRAPVEVTPEPGVELLEGAEEQHLDGPSRR
jgi:hypothetical protein